MITDITWILPHTIRSLRRSSNMDLDLRFMHRNNIHSFGQAIIVALIFISSYRSSGQEHRISLHQGINSAYVRGSTPFLDVYRRAAAYQVGIQYNVKFQYMFVGAGVSYIPRGFNAETRAGSSRVNTYYNNDYLGIPLNIFFRSTKRFFGACGIGLTPSFLVRSQVFFEDELLDPNPNGGPSKFDLGGQIDIGCGYRIAEKWAILTNIGLFRSFTKINNDNYFQGTDFRNSGVSILFGIEYKFKGED